jgi:hemerythrin-like domain-containing protein
MTLKSAVRNGTKIVIDAMMSAEKAPAARDILKTLHEEHDEVRDLLSRLQTTAGSSQRAALVLKIEQALVPHTKAEEKVVYDAVLAVKDKNSRMNAYEGYLEHEWASKTLQRLRLIRSASSAQHLAAARVLKELVEHHIRDEERNIWGDVREHFSDEQRVAMNRAFLAAKSRVKVP